MKIKMIAITLPLIFGASMANASNAFDEIVHSCSGQFAVWNGVDATQINGGPYFPVLMTVKIISNGGNQYSGYLLQSGRNQPYQVLNVTGYSYGNDRFAGTIQGNTQLFQVDGFNSLIITNPTAEGETDYTSFHFLGCQNK